jgi:hypothetical protein
MSFVRACMHTFACRQARTMAATASRLYCIVHCIPHSPSLAEKNHRVQSRSDIRRHTCTRRESRLMIRVKLTQIQCGTRQLEPTPRRGGESDSSLVTVSCAKSGCRRVGRPRLPEAPIQVRGAEREERTGQCAHCALARTSHSAGSRCRSNVDPR